jgi:hypothetical protein
MTVNNGDMSGAHKRRPFPRRRFADYAYEAARGRGVVSIEGRREAQTVNIRPFPLRRH